MHDLRIRRRVERATGDGRLRITLTQLWYACRSSNPSSEASPRRGIRAWVRWAVALPLSAALVAGAVVARGGLGTVCLWLVPVVLVLAAALRHRPERPASALVQPPESTFRALMHGAWTATYGGLPEGVVDDRRAAGTAARRRGVKERSGPPEVVVLCTEPVVARFLMENRLPDRPHNLLTTKAAGRTGGPDGPGRVREVLELLAGHRTGLPVVVVHDADAAGTLLVPVLRAAHPGRTVVDAGLRPGAVSRNRRAVRRFSAGTGLDAELLRTVAGVPEQEAEALAEGWWWPIAAVPPPVLAEAVTKAVEHAVRAPAPPPYLPGSPLAQGFLTWPDTVGKPLPSGAGTRSRSDRKHDRSTS
ncbi:hypothetical protein [Streptomyces sp. NBC_00102]|uniref:hypothetical protein n=1 Tax=Streptomyces sp. NBC_00102 TaxID=2975652 RepID=UPI0022538743|nr:hypothetical protein [Streptomyces sp. NBC_00102]MCX5401862.1 hypothetical protein [Streptomyces sp. NBC_00102]